MVDVWSLSDLLVEFKLSALFDNALGSSFKDTNADPIARLGLPGSCTKKLSTPTLLPKQGSNEIGVGSDGCFGG